MNRYTYAHNDPIQYLDPTGYAVTKKGSQGNQVVKIQEMLKDLGYDTGKVDGIFGKKTEAAVKQFQKENKLKVDGIVGDKSITALKTVTDNKNKSESITTSTKKSSSSGKTSGGIEVGKTIDAVTTNKKETNNTSQYNAITKGTSTTGKDVKNASSKDAGVKPTPSLLPGLEGKKNSNSDDKNSENKLKKWNSIDGKDNVTNSRESKKTSNDKGTGNSGNIDLSKLKPKDVTRAIAEYLIENLASVYATQHGWFKDLFNAAGFVRDDKGVYHARQDALQQYGGYNFVYDIVLIMPPV